MNRLFLIFFKLIIRILKIIIFLPIVIYIFSKTLDIKQFDEDIKDLFNFKL